MTLNLDLIHPFSFIQAWKNGTGCISLPCCLKSCISQVCFHLSPLATVLHHTHSLYCSLFSYIPLLALFERALLLSAKPILIFIAKILYRKNWHSKLNLFSFLLASGGLNHSPVPWRFSLWKHLLISRLSRPTQCQCSPLCLRRGENIPL